MPVLPAAVRSDAMDVPSAFISCRKDGIDVRLGGVEPRRNEHARSVCALLMNVVDDLRMPDVVKLRDGGAGFGLRKDVPVAIVIVADILLIELRRIGSFELRAQRRTIPAGDDIDAIRVQRGDQEQDRVVEDGLEARVVFGDQAIGELDRAVGGRDFVGVDRAGHQDDVLAFFEQRLGLRGGSDARIGQTALDLTIAIEVARAFRGRRWWRRSAAGFLRSARTPVTRILSLERARA